MRHDVHIVYMLTRNIYTKAITEVTLLNCFATMPQAKAALQYEYDIDMESCDPMDETDRPVWLNEDHTELRVKPGFDPSYETVIYIDSGTHFHDENEPPFKYGEEKTPAVENNDDQNLSKFRLLDYVCFNCDLRTGPEVIRGRLVGVSVTDDGDKKLFIGTIDRMVIESTGESFDAVSIRRNIPLRDLYKHPEDAHNARVGKGGC